MAQNKLKSRILALEDTLCLQECTFLITLYDRCSELSPNLDHQNCRSLLHYYTLRDVDSESARRVYGITFRCKERIEVHLSTEELFVESLFVACLLSGDSHIAHADNEQREHGRWVPNHTPNRDYTGIAYLNDNFTGGELVFPHLDLAIAPKPGLLVAFPSNHRFVHVVPKVLSGKRYSLPIWFTLNSAKAMQV